MSDSTAGLPSEVRSRLRELAQLWSLAPDTVVALAALLAGLSEPAWAPTTVTSPAQAVDAHVADSLAGLAVQDVRQARRIVDVGSGAGFPGLALAAALPQADVVLLESAQRKADFARDLAASARLGNVRVYAERAESWRGEPPADVVTARAVAPPAVVCEYAAPLLALGGALVAWQGRRDAEAERHATAAARELGMEPREVVRTAPYPGVRDHHLHIYMKVQQTPSRFPRRPGMARKRPLAGSG